MGVIAVIPEKIINDSVEELYENFEVVADRICREDEEMSKMLNRYTQVWGCSASALSGSLLIYTAIDRFVYFDCTSYESHQSVWVEQILNKERLNLYIEDLRERYSRENPFLMERVSSCVPPNERLLPMTVCRVLEKEIESNRGSYLSRWFH